MYTQPITEKIIKTLELKNVTKKGEKELNLMVEELIGLLLLKIVSVNLTNEEILFWKNLVKDNQIKALEYLKAKIPDFDRQLENSLKKELMMLCY